MKLGCELTVTNISNLSTTHFVANIFVVLSKILNISPAKTYEELKEVHRLVQDENIPISKLNELFDDFHFQHKPVLQPIRRRDDDINVSILRTGYSHRGRKIITTNIAVGTG